MRIKGTGQIQYIDSLACGHCKIHDFRNEYYMLFSGMNRY